MCSVRVDTVLAKQLRARRLSLIESTPEESIALKITEKLADTFFN